VKSPESFAHLLRNASVNFFGTVRCCKAFLPIFKSQATSNTYNDARFVY
jgi:hypothetical protein